MERNFTQSVFLASLFLAGTALAQTNSVTLKDGTNTVISSHSSITDAYTAIPATLTQAYTIELTSSYTGSTETYPIAFTAKTGASAANTITLRPATGVTTMSIQSSVSGSPVINLNDADYMVIDGRAGGTGSGMMVVRNTATSSSSNSIQLINGATFNTFRNLDVYNATTTNTGRAIAISSSASNPTGNSDNLFKYCNFTGGRYQFNNSGTAANPNTRNTVFGCNFRNANFAAYWGQAGSAKIRIDSCTFACTTPISESLYFGVLFDSQSDSAIIVNSRFYDIQNTSSSLRYIHIRSVLSSGTNAAEIRNNFFAMTTGNTNIPNMAAIEISSGGSLYTARVAHNSVRFGGTLASGGTSGNVGSSGLLVSATNAATTFSIQNNLFVNERSGGTAGLQHLALAITNTTSVFNLSGNTYNATSGNLTRWGTTVNTSIAAHQAVVTGGEPTANNVTVQYVSANDLHIGCAAVGNASLMATQLPGITTDIDGNPRGSNTYRGADEAGPVVSPTVSVAAQNNITCNGLSNGSATVTATGGTGFTYSWSPMGGTGASASGLSAGNYTVTATTPAGCVGTTTLTISQPAAVSATLGTVNHVTCNGANNGSASVNAAGGTGALTYSWMPSGGTAATASNLAPGNYTVTVKDANNCSTSRTLTISEPAAIDASVTQSGAVLTASLSGATYQWINCGTGNSPIAGQTAQSFTATASGSYAVIVTSGGCSKTSVCTNITISATGIGEQAPVSGLQLYPNPGTGLYTLAVFESAEVMVSNVIGEIVLRQTLTKGANSLNLEKQPNGIYTVNVIANGRSSVVKVVKQ